MRPRVRKIWCKRSTLLRYQVPVRTSDGSSGMTGLHEGPSTAENNRRRRERRCLPRRACMSEGALCIKGEQRRRKAAGFISQSTTPLPRAVGLIVPFVPPVVPLDSLCEDRTICVRRHQNIKRCGGEYVRPLAANRETKELSARPSIQISSVDKGAVSGTASESVASEWITAVSLLTTCLHALIRRSPPTFAFALSRPSANTRLDRSRSLIPVISGATAVRQTPPPPRPSSHAFTLAAVSPQATTQDFVIAF